MRHTDNNIYGKTVTRYC